jgi:hypothetical protein
MARKGYKGITLKESTIHVLSEITEKLAEANTTLSNGEFVESIPDAILYLCEQFNKYEGLNQGIQKLENHAEVETAIKSARANPDETNYPIESSAQRGETT